MPVLEMLISRFQESKASSLATTVGRFTTALSIPVAQVEAERQEGARAGRRFGGIFGTSGVANVTAVPTTTASWAIYNADLNRAYVIDSIVITCLSGTPGIGGTVAWIVAPLNAIPSAATGATVGSASGGGLLSKAVLAQSYTLSALSGQTQWGLWPTLCQPGSAAVGAATTADVRGGIIVPPGKVLGLALLSATGSTPLYLCGCNWFETQLDLE